MGWRRKKESPAKTSEVLAVDFKSIDSLLGVKTVFVCVFVFYYLIIIAKVRALN